MENVQNRALLTGAGSASTWQIFFSPLATLNSLSERPRWFFPLLLAGIYSTIVSYYVFAQLGFLRLVSRSVQANASLDPETVMQNALAHKTQIIVIQSLSAFLGAFATALVVALILWLVVVLVGGDAVFKNVMALVAHVTLFTTVIRETMLAITVTVTNDFDTFNFNNPLATNVAFFVHSNSRFAARILSSLDIITIASVVLLAVGLSKVTTRLSPTAAWLVVIVPWAIYAIGSASFTLY